MAFSYYRSLTVQSGQVPSPQTNFPVLVSVTDATNLKSVSNGGHVALTNGNDLRPYSDTALSSALTFELESYDPVNGVVVMWVKIPSLTSSSILYLAYGDSGLGNASSSTTWDSNFKGVWHLNGSGPNVNDSSQSAISGTNNGITAAAIGLIDGAATGGGGGYIGLGSPSALNITGDLTISFWLYHIATTVTAEIILGCYSLSGNTPGYGIVAGYPTDNKVAFFTSDNSGAGSTFETIASINTATWTFATMVLSGTSASIYLNATVNASATLQIPASYSGVRALFGRADGTLPWTGGLDEVRISNIARSANWITTEYNNQNAPGTFMVMGSEIPFTGGPTTTLLGQELM